MRFPTRRHALLLAAALAAGLAGLFTGRCVFGAGLDAEADRLADLLALRPGMTVAEIGAGDGDLAVLLAPRLLPGGALYATELSGRQRDAISRNFARAGLANVTVIEAADTRTNLPAECCDVIVMRMVYHHFSDPDAMRRSLLASLKPGGRLAAIEFPPRSWRGLLPGGRGAAGGHGITSDRLVREFESAGFSVETVIPDWPSGDYCVIARKPLG